MHSVPLTRTAITIVFLLSGVAQIAQVGIVIPSVAARAIELSDSAALIGVLAAIPWAVVLVTFAAPSAAARRLGPVRSVAASTLLSAGGMVLAASADGPVVLGFGGAMCGLGLSIRWVLCDVLVLALAPEGARGRIVAAHETLMGVGIAAGPAIIALAGGAVGSLFVAAGMSLVFGLFGLVIASAKIWSGKLEGGAAPTGPRGSYLALALTTPVLAAWASGLTEATGAGFLQQTHGLAALGAFGVGGVLCQAPIGWIYDRAGAAAATVVTSVVLCAAAGVLAIEVGELFFLAAAFAWGGMGGALNTLSVLMAGRMESVPLREAVLSLAASGYTVGALVGAFSFPPLVERLGPLVYVLLSVVGCAVILAGRRRR